MQQESHLPIFGKFSKDPIQSSSENPIKKSFSFKRKEMKNFAQSMMKNSHLLNKFKKDLEFPQQYFLIKSPERKNISLIAMKYLTL